LTNPPKPTAGNMASAVDVAKAAGVSQSTVSRAFSSSPGVSKKTRQRILEIAETLDYLPNALASSLITQSSGLIGIVVSDLSNPFLSDVLGRILKRVKSEKLQPLIFTPDTDEEISHAATDLSRYRVDGLLVVSPHLQPKTADRLSRLGPTVLLFNPRVPGLRSSSSVAVDNYTAGEWVADHLAGLGHEKFAYIHGLAESKTDSNRFEGFRDRLGKLGFRQIVRGIGGYSYRGAADAVLPILTAKNRPTAMFCANDLMAMGAMDAARFNLDLRVPQDLAVVGFDNTESAGWPSYSLTTVRQPVDAVLDVAMSILLGKLERKQTESQNVLLRAELIVRGSTDPGAGSR